MEIWKEIPIDGLEKYEISNLGQIKNKSTKRLLKFTTNKYGHLFLRIEINGKKRNFYIHRLVMLTFVGDNKGMVVNHINNIKNDNRLENLEYTTQKENMQHYYNNFHSSKGRNNKLNKIKELYNSKDWESAKSFFETLIKTI